MGLRKGQRHSGQFKKGDPRINHGGRPKGIMQYAREQTQDGRELIDFALKVLRVDAEVNKQTVIDIWARLDAMKYVTDRGFGKPLTPTADVGQKRGKEAEATIAELRAAVDEIEANRKAYEADPFNPLED